MRADELMIGTQTLQSRFITATSLAATGILYEQIYVRGTRNDILRKVQTSSAKMPFSLRSVPIHSHPIHLHLLVKPQWEHRLTVLRMRNITITPTARSSTTATIKTALYNMPTPLPFSRSISNTMYTLLTPTEMPSMGTMIARSTLIRSSVLRMV